LQDGTVEIEFFNRAITLFTTEDEVVKRIRRVMGKIDEQKGSVKSPYNMKVRDKKIPAMTNKIGRNEPCSCGSEKKYKRCCGKYNYE